MESTVPLDAHGNPIIDDDEILAPIEYDAQAEETIRLTSTRDEELDVDEVSNHTRVGFLIILTTGFRRLKQTRVCYDCRGRQPSAKAGSRDSGLRRQLRAA